jgi:hypothetical protein
MKFRLGGTNTFVITLGNALREEVDWNVPQLDQIAREELFGAEFQPDETSATKTRSYTQFLQNTTDPISTPPHAIRQKPDIPSRTRIELPPMAKLDLSTSKIPSFVNPSSLAIIICLDGNVTPRG